MNYHNQIDWNRHYQFLFKSVINAFFHQINCDNTDDRNRKRGQIRFMQIFNQIFVDLKLRIFFLLFKNFK